jgi:hypothetical protein
MPMTDAKIKSAFNECARILRDWPSQPHVPDKGGDATLLLDFDADTAYLIAGNRALWCAEEGIKLVDEGRREKAMRWLGFVQGVCYALGYASIDDLKTMSMPDPEQCAS